MPCDSRTRGPLAQLVNVRPLPEGPPQCELNSAVRTGRRPRDSGWARCPSRAGRATNPMISVPVKPTVTSLRSGGWLKRPRRA